jgi:hypothetical protein
VCAPHPCGPDDETCSDYVPQASSQNHKQISISKNNSCQLPDWLFTRQLLVMVLGMIMAVWCSGLTAWWLKIHSLTPTTKTITKSGLVR